MVGNKYNLARVRIIKYYKKGGINVNVLGPK